jgi:hypothetical protein
MRIARSRSTSPLVSAARPAARLHVMTRAVLAAKASYAGETKMVRQIEGESSNFRSGPCRLGVTSGRVAWFRSVSALLRGAVFGRASRSASDPMRGASAAASPGENSCDCWQEALVAMAEFGGRSAPSWRSTPSRPHAPLGMEVSVSRPPRGSQRVRNQTNQSATPRRSACAIPPPVPACTLNEPPAPWLSNKPALAPAARPVSVRVPAATCRTSPLLLIAYQTNLNAPFIAMRVLRSARGRPRRGSSRG